MVIHINLNLLKCVSIIIFFGLNQWNILAQNDLNRFGLHEKHKGTYASHVIFHWKPFGVKDTSTYHYQYFQQINESLITNDKAVVYTLWNDTLYMMNLQISDSIFCLRNTHYDTFSIANSNFGNFIIFLSNNLRSFHDFSGKQDFPLSKMSDTSYDVLDGTDLPIVSYSNATRKDSAGRFCGKREVMDIMSGDTLYQAWELSGMKISSDSFNAVFQNSLEEVRKKNQAWIPPQTPILQTPDSLIPQIELGSELLKELENSNITNVNIDQETNGKIKVFYFYFNGCIPCQMAKPTIRELMRNPNYELIVVNGQDKDSLEIMHRLDRDSILNVPVIRASKELLARFHVQSFPSLILFDPAGIQLQRINGYIKKEYEILLENLL